MNQIADTGIVKKNGSSDILVGLAACVLACKGMLIAGEVFAPLAAMVALFGTLLAMKNGNLAAIGVGILAWLLVIVALLTSPLIFAVFIGLLHPILI